MGIAHIGIMVLTVLFGLLLDRGEVLNRTPVNGRARLKAPG
jgi:hypothetical protein